MGRKPILTRDRLLDAIRRAIVERGIPPSVEELRRTLHVGSTRTILRHLRALEDVGDIERWSGARGIKLRRAPKVGIDTRPVPLVGQVPAGPLMVAEENVEGYVRLPQSYVRPQGAVFFLLRVRGDSMNRAQIAGDSIEDGDLVLVKQQSIADSGQIVVALIDGEATIKKLQHAPGYSMLIPQSTNRAHEPIVIGDDLRVLGVVQRVLKRGSDLLASPED